MNFEKTLNAQIEYHIREGQQTQKYLNALLLHEKEWGKEQENAYRQLVEISKEHFWKAQALKELKEVL